MSHEISTGASAQEADVLDHAREFVSVVYREAPRCYQDLLGLEHVRVLLEQENTLNHGKMYAYAEYLVFRSEFLTRFPDASPHACINAFSKLFLKNDISMTNLVNALEGLASRELLYIQGKRNPAAE